MVSLLIGLARLWAAIRKAWRDPTFRLLFMLTASLLLVGTLVFNRVEGWSYLDSFYFSAISLATVGYGDFTPHTATGKLLTVFYIFCGIGLLVALLTHFADALIQSERENQARLHLHLAQAQRRWRPPARTPWSPAPPRHPWLRRSTCHEHAAHYPAPLLGCSEQQANTVRCRRLLGGFTWELPQASGSISPGCQVLSNHGSSGP